VYNNVFELCVCVKCPGQQMYAGFGYVPTLMDVSEPLGLSVCSAPFISLEKKKNTQNIFKCSSGMCLKGHRPFCVSRLQ